MDISVIIPTFNEEKYLDSTVKEVNDYLSNNNFNYEIVIVDDGSTDQTSKIANNLASNFKEVNVLNNKTNKGKGYSVKRGILTTIGNIRLFLDADNSTSIKELDKVLEWFNEGYDIVIGSRTHKDSVLEPQPLYRQILGKSGNRYIQLLILPGIYDTQCGFKCFRGEVADEIFSQSKEEGWAFDVEALALARKNNFKIKEIPIHWTTKEGSTVKISDYFKMLIDVYKIRKRLDKH